MDQISPKNDPIRKKKLQDVFITGKHEDGLELSLCVFRYTPKGWSLQKRAFLSLEVMILLKPLLFLRFGIFF